MVDFGGNYCELKLLFCSSAEGCKVANSDLATSGETTKKRAGASIGLSNCLVGDSAPAITTTAGKTNDGSCGPTQPSTLVDCQNTDFGSCGNACCKLDVVVPVSTDVAMITLNKTLSRGGPDGLYELQMTAEGTLGFGDLKQFGSPLGKHWIGQVYHSTSCAGCPCAHVRAHVCWLGCARVLVCLQCACVSEKICTCVLCLHLSWRSALFVVQVRAFVHAYNGSF